MYFVYIIESGKNGRYYIGQTENLEARLERHNKGRNVSTKPYCPWKLNWWKEFGTRAEAMKMEKRLKEIKSREELKKYIFAHDFRGIAQSG